jgi:hypothetical protein
MDFEVSGVFPPPIKRGTRSVVERIGSAGRSGCFDDDCRLGRGLPGHVAEMRGEVGDFVGGAPRLAELLDEIRRPQRPPAHEEQDLVERDQLVVAGDAEHPFLATGHRHVTPLRTPI